MGYGMHYAEGRYLLSCNAEKIMKNVKVQGPYLMQKLNELKSKYDIIKEVRGLGLMIGVELTMDGTAIFKECFSRGLIINCTQGNVLRIMPALNVTRRQINKAIHILDGAIAAVTGAAKPQKVGL